MELQLTTQQLRYLVAISESETWTLAANKLGVSLSALSQGMSELEKRLGIKLFTQDGKSKSFNSDSIEVLEYAKSICAQTEDLSSWILSKKNAEIGELRIGMIDASAIHHFPTHLRKFREAKPSVEVSLTVGPSGELLKKLRSAKVDVAVIVKPNEPVEDLLVFDVFEEAVSVYGPAGKKSKPKDWGPWVSFPVGSHTRRIISKSLTELGASFEVVAESHQPEVLREMVNLGMGWTALPVSQAESGFNPLKSVRTKPLCTRTIVAVMRKTSQENPLYISFIDSLK